jgi:hypothetical protein
MATDSGIPSSTAPTTIAAGLSSSASVDPPSPMALLRSAPPRRDTSMSPTKSAAAPAAIPAVVGAPPALSRESSTRSNATELKSTPVPNAMTWPIVPVDHGRHSASAAPRRRDPAAKNPQKAAAATPGA